MIRVAVIGSGYFSQFHLDAWHRLPDAELVGLASLDSASLASMRERFDIPAIFERVDQMLDQVKPDLLDIVAPPTAHRHLLEEAAERGINVICQKPLGGDIVSATAMVETAESADITFVVHENFRFQPWYREIKRVLDNGALGDVTNISFRLRPGDGQGPSAYLDRQPYFQKMERFLIHETAIHLIDSFRFLMGEITAVYANLRRLNPAIQGEDAGYLLFDFGAGAHGLFDGNRLIDAPARNPRLTMGEMLVEGTDGMMRLDGDGHLWQRPFRGQETAHPYDWHDRGFGGDCVHAFQHHVVGHLLHGKPLENNGRAYLTNLFIEEAIYRSAKTGCRETIPRASPTKPPP